MLPYSIASNSYLMICFASKFISHDDELITSQMLPGKKANKHTLVLKNTSSEKIEVAKTVKYISAAWKVWITSAFLIRKIIFLQIYHLITIFLCQDTFYNDTRHSSVFFGPIIGNLVLVL
jgi:hypothetical protein